MNSMPGKKFSFFLFKFENSIFQVEQWESSGGLFGEDTRLKSRPGQDKFAFSVKCAKIPKLSAINA